MAKPLRNGQAVDVAVAWLTWLSRREYDKALSVLPERVNRLRRRSRGKMLGDLKANDDIELLLERQRA